MKIPKGWRKLADGQIICKGDKVSDYQARWVKAISIGDTVGWDRGFGEQQLEYIRRIKRKAKK